MWCRTVFQSGYHNLHFASSVQWRRKWQPIPVFLPGKSNGQRSPVGYIQSMGSQSQAWVSDWTTTTIILMILWKKILSNDHEILIVPPNSSYCYQTAERIRKPRLFFYYYLYFHKRHNLKSCVHLKAHNFQKSSTNTSYSLEKTWGNTGLPVTRTVLWDLN